jgi:hypothetical protein
MVTLPVCAPQRSSTAFGVVAPLKTKSTSRVLMPFSRHSSATPATTARDG